MLDQKYVSQGNAIATYPYTTIADGTGITTFYGAASVDLAGTEYFLTADSIYSDPISTETVNTTAALDFNASPFNAPKTVQGTALINIPYSGHSSNAGTQNGYLYFDLKHVSGGTATTMVTLSGAAIAMNGTSGVTTSGTMCLTGTVPQYHFKVGDILRVTANIYAAAANTNTVRIGHDPKDRADTSGYGLLNSQFKINIPFKLDV